MYGSVWLGDFQVFSARITPMSGPQMTAWSRKKSKFSQVEEVPLDHLLVMLLVNPRTHKNCRVGSFFFHSNVGARLECLVLYNVSRPQ